MRKIAFKLLYTTVLLCLTVPVYGQINGLWEVTRVTVAGQDRTPVAKWFEFKEDFTFESGNGWTKNSEGLFSFSFDSERNQYRLSMDETFAISEGADPFEVIYDGDRMIWIRVEYEEIVIVSLLPVNSLPRSPNEDIQGIWNLTSVMRLDEDLTGVFDPNSERELFIRPDRRYRDDSGPDGQQTGFWHIDGHQPILTIINDDESREFEVWEIEFDESKMVWKGVSGSNQDLILIYNRPTAFPDN